MVNAGSVQLPKSSSNFPQASHKPGNVESPGKPQMISDVAIGQLEDYVFDNSLSVWLVNFYCAG
jgi:hypothetical protein